GSADHAFILSCRSRPWPLPVLLLRFHTDRPGEPLRLMPQVAGRRTLAGAMKAAPAIDGKITPAEIAGLRRNTRMQLGDLVNGFGRVQSEFYVGHWADNLYVAVRCHEPLMTRRHVDGDVYGNDRVQVHVARPGADRARRFTLNAIGRMDPPAGAGWTGAAGMEPQHWTVEFLIPLRSVGGKIRAGEDLAAQARQAGPAGPACKVSPSVPLAVSRSVLGQTDCESALRQAQDEQALPACPARRQ
ncbi:MAG: hypothetical protein ACYS5V_16840, partial [Planctomycetota bacterium]